MINHWTFQSSSSPKEYTTILNDDSKLTCNCPGWINRRGDKVRECTHIKQLVKEHGLILEVRGEFVYATSKSMLKRKAIMRGENPTLPKAPTKNQNLTAGYVNPMLASKMPDGQSLPDYTDGNWVMEEKYNGHCVVFCVHAGEVKFWSRPRAGSGGKGLTRDDTPQHLVDEAKRMPDGTYHGEEIAGQNGSHEDVRRKGNERKRQLVVFDTMNLLGQNIMHLPYQERRQLLQRLFAPTEEGSPFTAVRLAESWPVSKAKLDEIWGRGGEGAILKRINSPYKPGWRSPDWVKLKKGGHATLIITGFEPGKNGPYSKVKLRDDHGIETSVKTLDNAWLREFEKNHKKYIGKRLVIAYTTKAPSGKYWNPMFDHMAGESE